MGTLIGISRRHSSARRFGLAAFATSLAFVSLTLWPQATAQKADKEKPRVPLDAPEQKPQPKFEPRQKFDDGPPLGGAADVPPRGHQLDHGFVGPRGTLHVCGWHGHASFLWPLDGKPPKLYRENMVYESSDADGLVFRLAGRFYRVWFKLGTRPDSSGNHPVWIRNGDRDWMLYQSAIVAPHAR
jgi:hypothetical protein